ncbi:gpmB, partial [Symbiodinium pilosum]
WAPGAVMVGRRLVFLLAVTPLARAASAKAADEPSTAEASISAGEPEINPKEITKAVQLLDRVFKREHGKIGQCGVVSELNDHVTWENTTSLLPQAHQCHQRLSTNCTLSFRQMQCPEECPFLAPDLHFPCMFSCRSPQRCSGSNVDTPFPDKEYNLCSSCSVVGCKYCIRSDFCAKCHDGFSEKDGSCIFTLTSGGWAAIVMYVLIGLIVLLVITAIVYCLAGS